MTFEQFYRILLARRKLALSLFLSILVLAIAFSLLWPKSYRSVATVMVDFKPDPVSGVTQLVQPASYIATQVRIIESDAVARRVVGAMGLASNQEMREKWLDDTKGEGEFEDWLGKFLLRGLSVEPGRDSSIIEIEYESVAPAFSAGLANAFAQSYIDTVVQMKTNPAKAYEGYFEERAQLAKKKLDMAQEKLSQAQKERGILLSDERLDTEIARLNEMGGQMVAIRSMLAESQSRRTASASQADQMQEVLSNNVIAALKADLARAQAKQTEMASQMGSNHPSMQQINASIGDVKRRIADETRRITGGVGTTATITREREAAAVREYDAQRERLLKMKEERNAVALLEREVESAQRVYEAIQLRASQSSLEGNSSQSNIYVLSPAMSPSKHAFPNLFLNLLLAIGLGGIVTLLVTLAAELLDRRVRTADDLIQTLEVPVIGVLPSPFPPKLKWLSGRRKFTRILPTSAAPNLS